VTPTLPCGVRSTRKASPRDTPVYRHGADDMGASVSRHWPNWLEKSTHPYKPFNKKAQLAYLLLSSLSKWILTVVLCISIYSVLWSYSKRDAMPHGDKTTFNTLIIALTVALSLNIASSITHYVCQLRWWLLSLRQYTPREVRKRQIWLD
jgi:hypothetical protein